MVYIQASADFNAAVNQVRDWKDYVDENRTQVLKELNPFLDIGPMRNNPIEFDYQLIIGRSSNKNASQEQKKISRDH